MQQREVEIINKLGLHARASAKLTQLAAKLLVAGRIEAVAGVNLPMLVRATTYRDRDLDTMIKKAISGGCDGVLHVEVDPIYAATRG